MKSLTGQLIAATLLAGLSASAFSAPIISGCAIFPENNVWNTPIDTLPVSKYSVPSPPFI